MVGIANICLCAASVAEKPARDIRIPVAVRFVTMSSAVIEAALKIVMMNMQLPEIEIWSALSAIHLGGLMRGFGLRLRHA